MTNREIYSKTLTFSLRRILFNILNLILFVAISAAGYFILETTMKKGVAGLAIGILIGLILCSLVSRFISYSLKAGQIAMMTKGVTEGSLPDDVYAEGKKAVKDRFATVAVYFAITGAVKSLFNTLGRLITKVGDNVGGDTGRNVTSAISTAIQVLVGYLCDCCLGWVFYRKDVGTFKAVCEGGVIFFKHGKTLLRNMGRIYGMGIASFIVIAGSLTAAFYAVLSRFPETFNTLAARIAENASGDSRILQILSDPRTLTVACGLLIAAIIWSFIHSTFIRPFILTGVLRNYMAAGMQDIPAESSFSLLEGKSKKFDKLAREMG